MKEKKILRIKFFEKIPAKPSWKDQCRLYPHSDGTYYLTAQSLKVLQSSSTGFEILSQQSPEETGIEIVFHLESLFYDRPSEEVQGEVIAYAMAHSTKGKIARVIYCGRTREDFPDSFILDRVGGVRNYRWRLDFEKHVEIPHLHDRFPKLIRKIKDPETRFVVSLGGGGLRLFALSSIFKILESLEVQNSIEEIWGCSGGAIFGLLYTMGASPQAIEQEGYDIYNSKYSLRLGPSKLKVLSNMFRNRLFPHRQTGLGDLVEVQNKLADILQRLAKHSRPSIPFYAVACNLDLKKSEVLTCDTIPSKLYEGLISRCSPMDTVLASSALPILFSPRVIKSKKNSYSYIDGAIVEDVPLISVYNKWQLDKKHHLTKKKKLVILVADLFPQFGNWKFLANVIVKYLPMVEILSLVTQILEIIRSYRLQEHLDFLRDHKDIEVIELHMPQIAGSLFNPKTIPTIIEKAQTSFMKQLSEVEKNL